jgi:uncharacterized protein YggT (Ycf19 family)
MRAHQYFLFVRSYALLRLTNFLVSLVDLLLVLRFFFKLFGANAAAPFTAWLYSTSGALLFPFRAIFQPVQLPQGGVIEWSILVAMLAYSVIGYLIGELLAIFVDQPEITKDVVVQDELDDISE